MTELATLADRRATYALLQRMLDWLPPARLSLRRPTDGAVKPGAGDWARCGTCDAIGRVVGHGTATKPCRASHQRLVEAGTRRERVMPIQWPYGHGCRPCEACDHGWIRLPWGRNAPAPGEDRMLTAVRGVGQTEAHQRSERNRWVDAQLAKLAALQLQHAGVEAADDDLTRAHAAKARLYGTGSFRPLETALDLLAISRPLRHAAIVFFVVEAQLEPNPDTAVRLDESVDWLAERMPRPILLPADAAAELAVWKHTLEHGRSPQHRQQRDARNAEIVRLVGDEAWSLRKVGRMYDLSHVAVLKIVQGAGERAIVASGPAA